MLYFGIPVASKKVLRNWDHSTKLLNDTLRSILNQTDPDLKVLVACHEVPEVSAKDDRRLEFLPVEFPPPIYRDEGIVDKHRKREVIAKRLRDLGGGYLMYVDSDDLVSNRMVDFVRSDQAPHGYILKTGYELDYARKKIRLAPRFHFRSGSCAIIKFEVEDLPEVTFAQDSCRWRDLINQRHPTWPEYMEGQGCPLKPLPFRGAMYVWNHGENLSALMGNPGRRRQIMRRLQFDRPPPADIVHEFSMEL